MASSEINVRNVENINELTITDIYGKEIYQTGVLNPTPELCEICIYDITSRRRIQKKSTNIASLNTSALPKGIYIYEVRVKNIILRKGKIIKD